MTAARHWLYLALVISVTGTLMHAVFGQFWGGSSGHAIGSDDAYISYRYSDNLFNGHGLVFNPGERVEGYSNFLFTVLVTPGLVFGLDGIYPFSIALNCVLLLLTVWWLWRQLARELGANAANWGALMLAASPWVWLNSSSGLETTLILAVTTGLWISVERVVKDDGRGALLWLGAFCTLSMLSRVDGFIVPVLAVFHLLLKQRRTEAFKLLLLILLVMGAYTVARLDYYDDVIANTYYNKVSGSLLHRLSDGLAFYAEYSFKTGAWIALLWGLWCLARLRSIRQVLAEVDFALTFIAAWSAYLIYIGGDVYFERFLVAMIPPAIYTVLRLASRLDTHRFRVVCGTLLAIPLLSTLQDGRFRYLDHKYDMWIETGEFLARAHPGALLAIDACGKVPFFSRLPVIDMLGLNDRHIGKMQPQARNLPGHTKFDPEYVLGRQPVLVAAWMTPDEDMFYGLPKEVYAPNYRLKYLVNASRRDMGERNIVDVSRMSTAEVRQLLQGHHTYAILLRRDAR